MAMWYDNPEASEPEKAGLQIFQIPARVVSGQQYPPAFQFSLTKCGRQRYQLDAAKYLPMFDAAKGFPPRAGIAALKAVGRGVPDVVFDLLHPEEIAELALAYEAWARTVGVSK